MRMDPGMLGVVVVTPLAAIPNCWLSLVRTLYCIDWCVRHVFRITWGRGGAIEDGCGDNQTVSGRFFHCKPFNVKVLRMIECYQFDFCNFMKDFSILP